MDTVDFYYYKDENLVRDSAGDIVYDIFRFIKPSHLFWMKKMKRNIVVESKKFSVFIEVHYPD